MSAGLNGVTLRGVLKLSADCEYEPDQFGNWMKRIVWVWSPELGNRKLYETDYRTLTYWIEMTSQSRITPDSHVTPHCDLLSHNRVDQGSGPELTGHR
jgi:hypothetical protein